MAHICTPSSVTYSDTFPLEGEGFRWFCKLYKECFKLYILQRYISKKQIQARILRTIAFPFEGEGVTVGDG